MSKFLDHIESFTGPRDTVLFREPLTAEVTWDVSTQRTIPFGKKYRIGVNFGAQIVSKDSWECGNVQEQIRKLLAHEVYGELDEVKLKLLHIECRLYAKPDMEAQNMAQEIKHILMELREITS